MAVTERLRVLLIDAARAFNAGRYFEAHELLEAGLEDVPDEQWQLFVGLIQVAVGYHKVTQGLHRGAITMLDRGLRKIDRCPSTNAAGVNVAALCDRVRTDLVQLRGGAFDADSFFRQPPRLQPRARR